MTGSSPKCPKCGSSMIKLSNITRPYKDGFRWVCPNCGKMIKKESKKELLAFKMVKMSKKKSGSLYDKLREKLRNKSRNELLKIFRREVLEFDEYEFFTKQERERLAAYHARSMAIRAQIKLAELCGDNKASAMLSKYAFKLKKENEVILEKSRRVQRMKYISDKWKAIVRQRELPRVQEYNKIRINNEEMIEAIIEMRLLGIINVPFDYEKYMRRVFKGRQKGRAYRTFFEH